MRLHNLDLHVAVIEDVRYFLERAGHSVDVHNLSGHTWALGRPSHRRFATIRAGHWEKDILRPWTAPAVWLAAMGFHTYAGGVVTHPASLALAYRSMSRPLLSVLCSRYEIPFSRDPARWEMLTRFFIARHDHGLAHFVANNAYDAAYFEHFTGIRPILIPSVCAYIDDHAASPWRPNDGPTLVFGEPEPARRAAARLENASFLRDLHPRYTYDQIVRARAHVTIPYNASTMSFFEHYRLGIPQFAPTPRFLAALQREGLALGQLTAAGFRESPVRRRGGALPDPNDSRNIEAWLPFHDIYTFPHIVLFDSFEELKTQLATFDGAEISSRMRAFTERRLFENRAAWNHVFEAVRKITRPPFELQAAGAGAEPVGDGNVAP